MKPQAVVMATIVVLLIILATLGTTEAKPYKNDILSGKRSCWGPMCAMGNMGAHAGMKAARQALLVYLRACAADPKCSPGKRRRRSLPNVSSLSKILRIDRRRT
ncbi:uncharacterized protein LOC131955626 [Physella acuta]|uniref:uncharacterized protein LOC131955626 n=1 Tax=Physella acuta TaxID=109671 RepID=UPI0027DE3159|nr:uncharacterized protein LOC131955626 [Physella acuta]XP_059175801.1 uncharacterized protein LOC131955626 [Physella acuta]XP_059175802.1 uncharacterized protein LOC131955626 [Physella acuta]XP_059175803.1 uncharacterized protein LOC131955626 [Physella acuta]